MARVRVSGTPPEAEIRRAASDRSDVVRIFAIDFLGRARDAETRRALLRLLAIERRDEPMRAVFAALRDRRDRVEIYDALVSTALSNPNASRRRSASLALRLVADKALIDRLVSQVEQKRTFADRQREYTLDGEVFGRSVTVPTSRDLLCVLTEKTFPANIVTWDVWWQAERETFAFPNIAGLPPPPPPDPDVPPVRPLETGARRSLVGWLDDETETVPDDPEAAPSRSLTDWLD